MTTDTQLHTRIKELELKLKDAQIENRNLRNEHQRVVDALRENASFYSASETLSDNVRGAIIDLAVANERLHDELKEQRYGNLPVWGIRVISYSHFAGGDNLSDGYTDLTLAQAKYEARASNRAAKCFTTEYKPSEYEVVLQPMQGPMANPAHAIAA